MNLLSFLKKPYLFVSLITPLFSSLLPDKLYLSLFYFGSFGKRINWSNPKTFNEKLQWLKIYYHNPLFPSLVDKYQVKSYVSNIIGTQYVIDTIGLWKNASQIDFDALPSQFVLKTTHDGGGNGVIICKDKRNFDIAKAREKLEKSLSRDLSKTTREWVYGPVERKIIAEPYLEDSNSHDMPDYKFFVFNGEVKALFIATERGTGDVKFDFYDENFNHLDIVQTHPMSGRILEKPKNFEKMKEFAHKLCKDIPFVRCDFYEVNGNLYFGELTFFHHGGFVPFHPSKWDDVFGDWIKLPEKDKVFLCH